MKKVIILFCIIFYSSTLLAQQGIFKLFPFGTATKIIQTMDGNFVTVIGIGYYFKLIKFDQNGDTIWIKSHVDNNTNLVITDIIETSDSSLVISGFTSFPGSIPEIYFLKTDKMGDVQTYKRIQFLDANLYYKSTILEAWNGGFVIAAGCRMNPVNEDEVLFIKLDSNGSVLFANIYNNPFGEKTVFDFIKAPDSTYIISGEIAGFTGGNLLIGKLNQIGQPLWWNFADDPFTGAAAIKIMNTYDNGYLLTCYDFNSPVLVKLDSLRNVEFAYSYIVPTTNFNTLPMPATTIQMPDSGYVLYCTGNANIFLIRTDKNGDTLWTKSYGTEYTDYVSNNYFYFQGALLESNNHFVFTFNVMDDSTGNSYSVISIIDTSGALCNEQPRGCTITSRNYTSTSANFSAVNVNVVDYSQTIVSWQDGISDSLLCTITSMTDELIESIPVSVFPNPFTDEIKVQITTGLSENNHLIIYNSYGLKCFEKFNISNTLSIDLHDLVPGLYFWDYKINDRNFTKKILKI